jgi:methionyl-tRNA formyltransferase
VPGTFGSSSWSEGVRVGYLCMQSEFSARPLRALLAAGHDVRFVLRPLSRDQRRQPVLERERGDGLSSGSSREGAEDREPFVVAAKEGIPRYWVGDASGQPALSLYERERPDLLVVAFFNQLLRAPAFDALPLGAINAHPSLLPAYRGPSPLFWTFRDARERSGVTVHRIARGEDDGDVLAQTAVEIPFGGRGEDLVPVLAAAAAEDLVRAATMLEHGLAEPRAQDHGAATRAPRPTVEDCRLGRRWSARRVFSFVRGVGRWSRLLLDDEYLQARCVDALAYEEGGRLPADHAIVGDVLTLARDDGTVTLRVREVAGA